MSNELTEKHSTSDACAKPDLESPIQIEKVYQARIDLYKGVLLKGRTGYLFPILAVCADEILPALQINLSFSGLPNGFMNAQ